ncbi:hypothetical protein [Paenibacillus taiwanensis]|nr:hypothetical protein [Paenibacillus taiwanensis]
MISKPTGKLCGFSLSLRDQGCIQSGWASTNNGAIVDHKHNALS